MRHTQRDLLIAAKGVTCRSQWPLMLFVMLMPKWTFQWGAQHLLVRRHSESPTKRISVDELIFFFGFPEKICSKIKENFRLMCKQVIKPELWRFFPRGFPENRAHKLAFEKVARLIILACAAIGVIFLSRHRAINGKCALEIIIKNYFFMYEVRICENHQKSERSENNY